MEWCRELPDMAVEDVRFYPRLEHCLNALLMRLESEGEERREALRALNRERF